MSDRTYQKIKPVELNIGLGRVKALYLDHSAAASVTFTDYDGDSKSITFYCVFAFMDANKNITCTVCLRPGTKNALRFLYVCVWGLHKHYVYCVFASGDSKRFTFFCFFALKDCQNS